MFYILSQYNIRALKGSILNAFAYQYGFTVMEQCSPSDASLGLKVASPVLSCSIALVGSLGLSVRTHSPPKFLRAFSALL